MEKQYITGSLLNTIIFQGGEITYLKEHIPESDADLKEIILCIAEQGKRIRNGFMGRQGKADTTNIYGERQVEMDKWADEVLVDALSEIEAVASVASE